MASLTNLLREAIDEYVLREIGDGSSEPYDYYKINQFQYKFSIDLDDKKIMVDVDFEDFDNFPSSYKHSKLPKRFHFADKTFNVAYKVGDSEYQFEKSTPKILLRILSTVTKIIKEFIKDNNPNILFIIATGRTSTSDNKQKHVIYDSFLWKQISSITNYNAENRSGGFILYNTQYRRT